VSRSRIVGWGIAVRFADTWVTFGGVVERFQDGIPAVTIHHDPDRLCWVTRSHGIEIGWDGCFEIVIGPFSFEGDMNRAVGSRASGIQSTTIADGGIADGFCDR
jgi:hypothetical protein